MFLFKLETMIKSLYNRYYNNRETQMTTATDWPFPMIVPIDANLEPPRPAMVVDGSYARANGISIIHSFDVYCPTDGFTIAYRKANNYKNCRMVEVAIAYCSPHDTFSKKKGSKIAVTNFLEGKTVLVPARKFNNDKSIELTLIATFSI